jgi:hypothetical protein
LLEATHVIRLVGLLHNKADVNAHCANVLDIRLPCLTFNFGAMMGAAVINLGSSNN